MKPMAISLHDNKMGGALIGGRAPRAVELSPGLLAADHPRSLPMTTPTAHK